MKKQSIRVLAFVAVAGTGVSSCTLLKDLEYSVTPCPLEMHGDSVQVKVDITFPEKGIKKKASAEITPMLGETALKPVTCSGFASITFCMIAFTASGSFFCIKPFSSAISRTVRVKASSFFHKKICVLPGLGTLKLVTHAAETDFSNTQIKSPRQEIIFSTRL